MCFQGEKFCLYGQDLEKRKEEKMSISNAVRMLGLGILTVSLIACGKSDEEKAQDTAEDLVAEYNQLVRELTDMGVPSSSWSDEKLDSYEGKVNRFADVNAHLSGLDGTNGITLIGGGDPDAFISYARSFLSSARAEKVRRASAQENVDRFNELATTNRATYQKIIDMGTIEASWSEQKIQRLISLLDSVISNTNTREQIVRQNRNAFSNPSRLLDGVREQRTNAERAKQSAQQMLELRQSGGAGTPSAAGI